MIADESGGDPEAMLQQIQDGFTKDLSEESEDEA